MHRRHYVYNHNISEEPVKCTYSDCKETFLNVARLRKHIQQRHQKQKAICNDCGKMYSSKYVIGFFCNDIFLKHNLYLVSKNIYFILFHSQSCFKYTH